MKEYKIWTVAVLVSSLVEVKEQGKFTWHNWSYFYSEY